MVGLEEREGDGVVGEEAEAQEECVEGGVEPGRGGGAEEGEEGEAVGGVDAAEGR